MPFKKNKENFVCRKCGKKTIGSGYSDHCPSCLWSRHVDIWPGDRKNKCRGLMEPVAASVKKDDYLIYYQCQKCGYCHRVKSALNDNFKRL
jgi:rubrerythrin